MSETTRAEAKSSEAKKENVASQKQNTDSSQSISSPEEQILFLQRTIGNQAVGRLIRSGALQKRNRASGRPSEQEHFEPLNNRKAALSGEEIEVQTPNPKKMVRPVPGNVQHPTPTRPSPTATKRAVPPARKPTILKPKAIGKKHTASGGKLPMPVDSARKKFARDFISSKKPGIADHMKMPDQATRKKRIGPMRSMTLSEKRSELPAPKSPGAKQILEQTAGAARIARQSFAYQIACGAEVITARVLQTQQSLNTSRAQQGKAVQDRFSTAQVQIGEHITNTQSQLQTDATTQQSGLSNGHAQNLVEAETVFTMRQERASSLGDDYADRSINTANDVAEQFVSRIQGHSQEALSIGETKARIGGSTPEIAEAKAKAAHDIASDTASKISAGVTDGEDQLRDTGPQAASAFRQNGLDIATQLGAGKLQLVDQLTSAFQNATGMLEQASTDGSQQLGHLKTEFTSQLASAKSSTLSSLHAQVEQKIEETHEAGEQAIATLDEHGQKAIAAGNEKQDELNRQIATMIIPEHKSPEIAGKISGQVSQAFDSLTTKADDAVQQIGNSISQSGISIIAASGTVPDSVARQAQGFVSHTAGQVGQMRQSLSSQMVSLVGQANRSEIGTVSQVGTSLDGKLVEVDQSFAKSFSEYLGKLNEQVITADSKAKEPISTLTVRIEQAQDRAEIRTKQSWLKNQWDDFVEMVSDPGFVAGLIVGLVLAILVVVLVIAGVLTGGLAIILAMALVGAIAAAVGSIVTQATQGSWSGGFDLSRVDWGKVAVAALIGAVAAAAITGLVILMGPFASSLGGMAIISVATGVITVISNLIAGQPWDKGLLANMAFAFILAWLGKILMGRWGGGPRSSSEPPGTRPPGTEPPGTEPPGTRPPGTEPPGTEPPGTEPARPRGGGCFVPGTLVHTKSGRVQIEQIAVGTRVPALSVHDGVAEAESTATVCKCFKRMVTTVLDLQIGQETITCSAEHPFWVPGSGWCKAGDLTYGTLLLGRDRSCLIVDSIVQRDGSFTVYNLEVDGPHDYFVGGVGVLVHNKANSYFLQDRAVALEGRVTEVITKAESLPHDAPGRSQIIEESRSMQHEASDLASKGRNAANEAAIESERSVIEGIEERLSDLETRIEVAELPTEVPGLQTDAENLLGRAERNIPAESPGKWEIIGRIRDLQRRIGELREYTDAGLVDKNMVDEYWRLRQELARLDGEISGQEPVPPKTDPWQARLDRATWSDHGGKHMQARTAAEAREMTTPTDRNPDPASQYLPEVNNQALELEALRHGEVIRGDPTQPEGTVHVRYDTGRIIGYDGGEPVTTIRAEISNNVYHGHPRRF